MRYLFTILAIGVMQVSAQWSREHWQELDRQIQYEQQTDGNKLASSKEVNLEENISEPSKKNWFVKEKEDWKDIRRKPNKTMWNKPQQNELPPWMSGSSKSEDQSKQINEQTRQESQRSRSGERSSSTQQRRKADVQLENPAWLQVLLWVLIAIAAGVLAFFIIRALQKPRSKKIKKTTLLHDVSPVEIPLSELDKALQAHLANKDYRSAVRILFLYVLKKLGEKELIAWKKEKTNYHYYHELTSKGLSEQFGTLATVYEWVWYGERYPDESAYQKIDTDFRAYLKKVE